MRGAIVEGEFFHNKIIVYGKGLVEAVQLEENVVKYPRIIVKTKVNEANNWHYLMKDNDGEMFLNIFRLCEVVDDVTFKINLLKMLKVHKENDGANKKIMWMINYFNSWFAQCGDPILNKQKITDEEINKIFK